MGKFRDWRRRFQFFNYELELYTNMNDGPKGVELSLYRYAGIYELAFCLQLFIFRFEVILDYGNRYGRN